MDVAPRTIKNDLSCLSEILRHSVARKYTNENILDALTDSDRRNLYGNAQGKPPNILTPEEAERLLRAAQENPKLKLLGAVTLGLFCGIRTEEFQKLVWNDIRSQEGFVTLAGGIAKKRSIRNVTITENAKKWLSICPNRRGTVTKAEGEYYRNFERLLKEADFVTRDEDGKFTGYDWKRNSMRHSFGSYHFALHGDSIKTSNELGHRQDDQMLFDHYRALTTKKEAKAYFAIKPPR